MFKNLDKSSVLKLIEQIPYALHQVSSRTIAQNKHVSLTLFSFDKDEEISTHKSKGDALVQILDGSARITIDNQSYTLVSGESILMPAEVPHALYAVEKFKMLLTVVFPISHE